MWTLALTKMGLPPTSILEPHLLSFICLSLSVSVDHGHVQALEKLSGPQTFWPFLFSFSSPLRLDPTTKHFCFFTCQLYFFTSFPSVFPLQVTEQSYPRGINHLLFLLLKKEYLSYEWEWSRGTYWLRHWIFSLNLTLRNPLLYSWFYSAMQLPQTQTSLSAGTPACLQELRLSALKLWHTVPWILPGLREPCIFSKANSYIWLALDFSSWILLDLVLAIKPFLSFTFFQRLPPQFLIPN